MLYELRAVFHQGDVHGPGVFPLSLVLIGIVQGVLFVFLPLRFIERKHRNKRHAIGDDYVIRMTFDLPTATATTIS